MWRISLTLHLRFRKSHAPRQNEIGQRRHFVPIQNPNPGTHHGQSYRPNAYDNGFQYNAPLPPNFVSSQFITPPANTGDSNIIHALIEDGRRRDAILTRLVERLTALPNQGLPSEPNLNYNIMPDLTKQIEPFNGETSGLAAREWVKCISGMQRLHHWPDNFALEIARMQLKGGAKDWYRVYEHELYSWPLLRAAFYRTFVTTGSHATKWKNMVERVQRKDEPVTTYYHAKAKLCKALNLELQDITEQVLIGVWSKDLCNAMATRNHRNLDELFSGIMIHTRIKGPRKLNVERGKALDAKSTPHTMVSSYPQPTSTFRTYTVKTEMSEIKCYNCKNLGRISKDCPRPQRVPFCSKCRQQGHTQSRCTSERTPETNNVNQVSTSPARPMSTYLKEVTIGQNSWVGFVDTGAAVSTIRVSQALFSGLRAEPSKRVLKGFGAQGSVVESPGITTVNVTIDDVTVENLQLHIVPDEAQSTDLLIGQTFSAAPGVTTK